MRKFIWLPLLLAACSPAVGGKSYVGKDVKAAVLEFGSPTNVVELQDGRRAYQWSRTSSSFIPDFLSSDTSGQQGYLRYDGQSSIAYNPCYYTLIAEPRGGLWVVTDSRRPERSCK